MVWQRLEGKIPGHKQSNLYHLKQKFSEQCLTNIKQNNHIFKVYIRKQNDFFG